MPLSLKNQGPCHYLGGSQWLRAKNLKSGSFSIFVGRQSMSTFCPLHTVTPYLRLSKVAPVSLLRVLTPPFPGSPLFICDPPPTQPDLTDKCSVNCFLIV